MPHLPTLALNKARAIDTNKNTIDISMVNKIILHGTLSLLCLYMNTGIAQAQDADELAKATVNPVSDLIALPLQSNWDKGYGPGNKTQYTLNVQPVIPFKLNNDWNLITRTIVPVVHQPGMVAGQGDVWGIGDTVASFFLSPRQVKGMIWGVGPVLLLPTANEDRLGSKKWGAGPTGVALIQEGPWTYGALANHIWSYAGAGSRSDVNTSYVNPFASYGLGGGWTLTGQGEVTYNWEAESGKRATIPMSVMVSKVTRIGMQPVSLALGYKHYVKTPDGNPDNGIRFVISFLFPK